MNVSRRFVEGAGLFAVVAGALIARFHAITAPGVWYDEAFSLLLAEHSPADIWSTTARDVHPPLYYLVLHYWMLLFGNGVLAARALSALADVGTLLLSIKLMSLISTRRATWMAALLLALLPISVRYSQEIRMYTLLGFWLMGATVALVCWVNAPQQKRFAVVYVLLMTAAFYTHYFAALCVLVHWMFWWQTRGVSIQAWMAANGAIVLLFLPWMPHFIDQLFEMSGPGWIPPLTWQTVLTSVWQFTVMGDPVSVPSGWRMVPSLIVLACAAALLLKDRKERPYAVLIVGYFFVPILTVFLLSLFVPLFTPRYLTFAAVGLPLICAAALDSWGPRRPLFVAVAVGILVIGQLPGLLAVYRQTDGLNGTSLRKDFRLDTIAAYISLQMHPRDKIVLDSLIYYLPFAYYNTSGIQPKFHIKSSLTGPRDDLDRGGYALITHLAEWVFFNDVGELKRNGARVWWITDSSAFADNVLLVNDWTHTLTIKGAGIEARLFTLDAAPASPEADAPAMLTQQPPR